MMTMGEDFQYENANTWYKNLDKLMYYVNKVCSVYYMVFLLGRLYQEVLNIMHS